MLRHESYQPTIIEWASEIPESWDLQPIRALFNERKERNDGPKTDFILSVMKDVGVIPYDEKGNVGNKKSENIENYKVVYPGDLVVNKMNAIIGSLGISRYHGALSQVYFVLYPKDHARTNHKYLGYLFKVKPFQKSLIKISKGMMELRESIEFDEFKKLVLPVPPLHEQDSIVAFLDQKTAEIDAAIAKKERLIELLNEQKKTFVEHLVCRGLGSGVPTRNSGVDSVGTIPEHWRVKKLGHLANIVRGASPRPAGDPRYFSSEEGVPWVTVAEVTKDEMLYLRETKEFLTPTGARQSQAFHRGTVIFTNSGATLGVPKILDIDCCANDGIVALKRLSCEVNKEFLYYFLSTTTERLREEMKQGGGQPNLNTGIVKSIAVPLPPVQEQVEIVKCINLYLGNQQTLLRQTRASIEQLQKLKETLIAEVVAGKLKL